MGKDSLIKAIVKSDLTARQKMYLEELVNSARFAKWDCGMRLIDADSIEWESGTDPCNPCADMCFVRAEKIDEMQTVNAEPVKYGKWTYDGSYALHCSHCGREAYYSEWGAEKFPFCPYCGADMYKD